MRSAQTAVTLSAALLLGALPLVAAHGEGHMDMGMGMEKGHGPVAQASNNITLEPALPNYFRHEGFAGWMVAHIALMTIAWVFILPVAIMLSVAKSRYNIPAQLLFHLANGLGVFTSFVYNHATPDLYANNAHHPLGWAVTAITVTWTVMSTYVAYSDFRRRRLAPSATHSMTSQAMAQYDRLQQQYSDHEQARWSRDSGQGTERNSASLFSGSRQNSTDSVLQKPEAPESPQHDNEYGGVEDDDEPERRGFLGNTRVDRFLSRSVHRFATPRASNVVRFTQIVLEKFLLLLGFAAILSGWTVYGGIFRDNEIFSGMAHFVKGGIFFWYGLLTLGRWMGAFTEFGWAWNIRPEYPLVSRWKARVPSAEFTESFVIWLYGASNVFLEHLNNWGGSWSPQDFEHVSITVLFFGGGLLGMLVESRWARDLANTAVIEQKRKEDEQQQQKHLPPTTDNSAWREPATYRVPLNPLPGLVIMLLGIMMSAHHQQSMVSTMMHSQWGTLFAAFALARAATYITLYLAPPTSHYPSRPPSELVAAFCLTAGGLMFMFSAHDTVGAVEANGLDAMTIFTVTMGLTGVLMAWVVVVFAVKGWALRRERPGAEVH